jgi:hypothetical protein
MVYGGLVLCIVYRVCIVTCTEQYTTVYSLQCPPYRRQGTSVFCTFLLGIRSYATIALIFVESYLQYFAGSFTSLFLFI